MKINLFGDTGESWNNSISAAECVNMLPVVSKSKKSLTFQKNPGSKFLYDTGNINDIIRGMFTINGGETFKGRTYFVVYINAITSRLHSIDSAGTEFVHTTNISDVSFSSRDIFFALNNNAFGGILMIGSQSSASGFSITLGNTPSADTISAITFPSSVEGLSFYDGYYFCTNENKIYSTGFGNTTWSSTVFGLVTSKSGNIVSHVQDNRSTWLLCEKHIELWRNIGTSPFPLGRNSSVLIDIGLLSRNSLINYSGTMIFVGKSNRDGIGVFKLSGQSIEEITPEKLKDIFYAESGLFTFDTQVIEYCWARSIVFKNVKLYVLTYPDSKFGSWVYNLDTGLWSKDETGSLGYSQYVKNGTEYHIRTDTQTYYNLVIPLSYLSSLKFLIHKNEVHYLTDDNNQEVLLGYQNPTTYENKNFSIISNYIIGEDDNNVSHLYLKIKFAEFDISDSTVINVSVYYSDDEAFSWILINTYDINKNNGLIEIWRLGMSKKRLYKIVGSITNNSSTYKYPITLTDTWVRLKQLNS